MAPWHAQKSEINFHIYPHIMSVFFTCLPIYDFMTDMFTQVGNTFQALINYNSQLQRLSIESSNENRDFWFVCFNIADVSA